MTRTTLSTVAKLVLSLVCISVSQLIVAQTGGKLPDFYKEPGMQPNRDYVNQHFGEHIDPFTGALQLHYVDVFIPGNGGFDLKVQRSYNSASVDRVNPKHHSMMGVGWSLHMGRVSKTTSTICSNDDPDSGNDNPVLETPDGGTQRLYFTSSGSPLMLTQQRWRAECITGTSPGLLVTAPNGTSYRMNRQYSEGTFDAPVYTFYTTLITDRNGNTMTVNYNTATLAKAEITSISASDGRSVTFTYDGAGTASRRIRTIAGPAGTWTYSYTAISGKPDTYQLTGVNRPVLGSWSYAYNNFGFIDTAGNHMMDRLTMPEGGSINYDYANVSVDNAAGGVSPPSMVTRKTTSDSTWTWTYNPASSVGSLDTTTLSTPAGTHTYKHFGANSVSSGNVWKIGLLDSKSLGSVQSESYEWDKVIVSGEPNNREGMFASKGDTDTYQPVMSRKSISRGTASFVTTYSGFDAYGNPTGMTENGPNGGSRSTTLSYFIDTGRWIVNFVRNESRSGGQNVTRSYDSNGNMTSICRDSVCTGYGYDGDGNVTRMTSPRGFDTLYGSHFRGIPQSESRPAGVAVSRDVSSAGNVTSETVGGQTFGYGYDGINRITSINYPVGGDVGISYGSSSRSATRDGVTQSEDYNGYGHLVSTSVGTITIDYGVDALGRRTSETQPNSTNTTGYDHDILGRVTRITHPGGSARGISYGGSSKTVTNERNFATTYFYRSYGDPNVQFLTGITAPEQSTSIGRNSRDLIDSVTQGGITRDYGYNGQFYLTSITDPETGTTTFGRDSSGNMTSRRVGSSGTTQYDYDGLDRLVEIRYPNARTINKTHNGRGKVLSVTGGNGNRFYRYDGNDNLISDEIEIDGLSFTASYGYNDRDQLASITYPRTGRTVSFSPNAWGWPTQAGTYATGASYFASGNVDTFNYGNGKSANYGQDNRLRVSSLAISGVMNSTYGYDATSNLTSISDSVDSRLNRSSIGYDGINRLTAVSGPWSGSTINYDGRGNITSRNDGTSTTLTYNSSNNRLASATGLYSTLTQSGTRSATYTYDNYGNIINDGTNTFDYDDAPNLTCSNCSDPAFKTEYFYDGNNSRTALRKNGLITYEFHDSAGRLLMEFTPSDDNQTTEHIYMGDKRVAQRSFNSRTSGDTACFLDVSGDAVSNQTDALILERYALGIRGDALIQGITGHSPAFITLASAPTSTQPTSVDQIQIRLNQRFTNSDSNNANNPTFDIDQDSSVQATTDALLIVRYLRGQLGIALTNDATNPSGSRGISSSDTGTTLANKIAAIQGYLDTLCSPQANGETITYFHTDLVGSPVAATDASGNVIWRESYRAYGDRLTNQPNNGTASDRNVLHFSNKKTEALKGGAVMSYFGARYYLPAEGRFLSVDPMYFTEQSIHSFNRYAYANNNPYRFVDPDGNQAIEAKEYSGLMSRENAERAAQYWADRQVATDNVLYAVPGVLAVMWANNGPELMAIMASTRGGGGNAINISRSRFPESAKHIDEAISAGRPSTLTIDRAGAASRRQDAMKGTQPSSGKDRDEYPPAMFREGGAGASVRSISPSDNRGSGACIGAQCRGLADGTKVDIKVTP
jgi:RHS repeat-associated protein